MKKLKLIFTSLTPLIIAPIPVVSIVSCSNSVGVLISTVTEHPTFRNMVFAATFEDLKKKGFSFGDEVAILDEKGKTIAENVPFYSGYYVKHGQWVMVAHASSTTVSLTKNCRQTPPSDYGLKENSKITIKLTNKRKYLDEQNIFNVVPIIDDKGEIPNEKFCNFRDAHFSNESKVKENILFRGFSPVFSSKSYGNRAERVNQICKQHNIDYCINLANTLEKVQQIVDKSKEGELEWVKDKLKNKQIECFNLPVDFSVKQTRQQVGKIMLTIINNIQNNKKTYIHCDLGQDRTGIIFMLIQALCGSPIDAIKDDFMKTFENLYDLKKGSDSYDKYIQVYFASMLEEITAGFDNPDNLQDCAHKFLLSCEMKEEEINTLINLMKK